MTTDAERRRSCWVLRGTLDRFTRLLLPNLPLPLPLTSSVADRILPNAVASPDGLLVITAAQRQWDFELRLPSAAEALVPWARDLGFDVAPSRDGLDATAVLERLDNVREIRAIADARVGSPSCARHRPRGSNWPAGWSAKPPTQE